MAIAHGPLGGAWVSAGTEFFYFDAQKDHFWVLFGAVKGRKPRFGHILGSVAQTTTLRADFWGALHKFSWFPSLRMAQTHT